MIMVYAVNCIANSLSQMVYAENCIAHSLSQMVYAENCIAHSLSQMVYAENCIANSLSQIGLKLGSVFPLVRNRHVIPFLYCLQVLLIESEDDVRRLAKHFVDAVAPLPMSSVFQHAMGAPQLSPSTSPGRTEEPYDIQSAELGEGMRKLSLEPPSSFGETVSPSVAESYQYQADNQGTNNSF